MNKQEGGLTQGLFRRVLYRAFVASLIYIAAIAVIMFVGQYICSLFIWYGDEFFYRFVKLFLGNPLIMILIALLGLFAIIIFYWRKTMRYIEMITRAESQLLQPNDELIQLPPELRLIEDQLNRAKQNFIRSAYLAKEAEQRKNDLIVYLAHDLKTPLTSVIGYLTLLRDERDISPALQEKYLSISLRKAERLEELINEFFEITRFNLSHLTLDPSHVNLSRMLEQICYEFEPGFAEKKLACELHVEPDVHIQCDADKMQRVFDNVIRNAVNYSFVNSTLTISAAQKPDGVEIVFHNWGNTIPSEKLSRIFEQFYRLDTARSTKSGGAGLGLAIAKEIVELHGGTIQAASHSEQIWITVFLPVAQAPEAHIPALLAARKSQESL